MAPSRSQYSQSPNSQSPNSQSSNSQALNSQRVDSSKRQDSANPNQNITTGATLPNSTTESQTDLVNRVVPSSNFNQGPSLASVKSSPSIIVKTSLYTAKMSSLGGRITSLLLKNYRAHEKHVDKISESSLVEMVHVQEGMDFPLGVSVGASGSDDGGVVYAWSADGSPVGGNSSEYTVSKESPLVLTLKGSIGTSEIIKRITFFDSSYGIVVSAKVESVPSVQIKWGSFVSQEEARHSFDPLTLSYLTNEDSVKTIPLKDPVPSQEFPLSQWVGIGSKYFLAALAHYQSSPQKIASPFALATNPVAGGIAYILSAYAAPDQSILFYGGPRATENLKAAGGSLHRAVDLGYFAFLASPLLAVMKFFYAIIGNYGLAIILLTLAIKLLFLPLTRKSFESMAAMQEIQPEVQALRERVKDATQLNQELMALYKRKGVNPLGGCLPVLIQIPVFLGLYNALLQSIELRHEPFALWIHDLSSPERLLLFGIPIPIMIILLGISMFFQQWSQPKTTMDPTQQKVMLFMPVIFTGMFIVFPMPAGLVLYWLVNNLISIVQQIYLKGHRKANPLVATIVASMAIFVVAFCLTLLPS